MPRLAGALNAMQGVVGKAVELAGEYKGLLQNKGGIGRAGRKSVNEMSDNHIQKMTKQAREAMDKSGHPTLKKEFEALRGGQMIKSKNVANKYSRADSAISGKYMDQFNVGRLKKQAAGELGHDNISQKSFDKAFMKKEIEAGARTAKNATQDYFLDPLKAFKNSTGEAKSLAGKQAAARIGTAAVGLGTAGVVATNEL